MRAEACAFTQLSLWSACLRVKPKTWNGTKVKNYFDINLLDRSRGLKFCKQLISSFKGLTEMSLGCFSQSRCWLLNCSTLLLMTYYLLKQGDRGRSGFAPPRGRGRRKLLQGKFNLLSLRWNLFSMTKEADLLPLRWWKMFSKAGPAGDNWVPWDISWKWKCDQTGVHRLAGQVNNEHWDVKYLISPACLKMVDKI